MVVYIVKIELIQRLVQSPASAGPLLEESIRVISLPGLESQLLGCWADSTPVILAVVSVIHEQRSVHIRQATLVDVLLNQVTQALINFDGGGVNLLVINGQAIREIDLEEDVGLIRWNIKQIL